MDVIKLDKNNRDSAIAKAVELIKNGGVVVARADTSYALLSKPDDARARRAMDKIKAARGNKQYSLFAESRSYILENVRASHRSLVEKLLPGCVSIVIDRNVPALRYIKNDTINAIVAGCGQLTATSANPSGSVPARNMAQINKYFSDSDALVLFEGTVPKQLPSTIIDVSADDIVVLRQGAVKVDSKA